MISTQEQWEAEYTSTTNYNYHKVKRINDWTSKKHKEYRAEVRWNRKGKLEYNYMITSYEYEYMEDELVSYIIIERRQYKTRNAMMNRIRKIEKDLEEKLFR